MPTAVGLQSGLSFKSDFERTQYNELSELVPAELVLDRLRRIYGDRLDNPEYDPPSDLPLEMRVALQFAFVHAHVLKEREEAQKTLQATTGSSPPTPPENGN